jgi:hypothetical protein
VSIALSELEQPHDRYLARSSQGPFRFISRRLLDTGYDRGSHQEDLYGLVAMTAVTGGFKAKQDQP